MVSFRHTISSLRERAAVFNSITISLTNPHSFHIIYIKCTRSWSIDVYTSQRRLQSLEFASHHIIIYHHFLPEPTLQHSLEGCWMVDSSVPFQKHLKRVISILFQCFLFNLYMCVCSLTLAYLSRPHERPSVPVEVNALAGYRTTSSR